MTRKDFQLIAGVVKTIEDKATRDAVTSSFALRLKAANPNLDWTRFVEACQPS